MGTKKRETVEESDSKTLTMTMIQHRLESIETLVSIAKRKAYAKQKGWDVLRTVVEEIQVDLDALNELFPEEFEFDHTATINEAVRAIRPDNELTVVEEFISQRKEKKGGKK